MNISIDIGGEAVLLDDCDAYLLEGKAWRVSAVKTKKYLRWSTHRNGRAVAFLFHRLVAGAREGQYVDHINGNSLDNRRENLRIVSTRQNNQNMLKITARATASRFKGVSWNRGRWTARIRIEGKHLSLGRYDDEAAAAMAYDLASVVHHGAFGARNFYPLMT